MKKVKFRGLSEGNLNRLWRKVVLEIFGGKCFFCGAHHTEQEIECHHTVKRKNFLLRYNWRNGIPSCKWVHGKNGHLKMSCHQFAETPEGKHIIDVYQARFRDYLTARSGVAKQWFVEHGITKRDYLIEMYNDLSQKWAMIQIEKRNDLS